MMSKLGDPNTREALGNTFIWWLRGRFYRWKGPSFGLREALLWSTAIDTWHRYAALMEALRPRLRRRDRILEIGPGWFGLEFFLSRTSASVPSLVQVDIRSRPPVRHLGGEARLIGSGVTLPAKDDAFDFVVAMDVLEHVPRDLRISFAHEMRRVARRAGFLHMPLESEDGIYQAVQSDIAFQRWFESRFGRPEPNIDEHVAAGHPTLEELRGYFPTVVVRPTQSVRDWLWYMTAERTPTRRALTGLIRYLRGAREGPPYYSGLAIWEAD